MKKADALVIAEEIEVICKKRGLWITTEKEFKPDLKMIRIKEISIKVTDN